MREYIYAANWKMHKTQAETVDYLESFLPKISDAVGSILIAPPFTSLMAAATASNNSDLIISAQNCHFESKGAFTGEVTTEMVKEAGARAVILGHSERRHVFGEDDELINKKISAVLAAGMTAVFCIGELIEEREAGNTNDVLKRQLTEGLKNLSNFDADTLVIAYEPVWAIGTGKTATPEIAQQAHQFVRATLAGIAGDAFAGKCRILYGGSVKPANIDDLMAQPDIDGVLVGGASLEPESFAAIVNHAK